MKKTIQYLALACAAVVGLASCVEKAPAYEAADPVGNSEVFFAPTLPASYNLKGNEGTLTVTVSRVSATSGMTVNLTSSAPGEFTVPSSVTFDAGAKTANIDITFDPESLVEEMEYPFTLTLTDETTPYGAAEYSFTASIPASWVVFAKGTLTEGWWGEVEPGKTLLYQDIGDHLRLCKIEACFGHDTGPEYDVQDYIFYWDTETNFLSIPMHYMGYTNGNGYKVYYGDAEAFYRSVYEYDDELMQKNGYADVAAYAYKDGGRPYYDGNGGFYLRSWYFFSKEDKAGSGYDFGDSEDVFICNGFVRRDDYNDEKHLGASSALYEGYVSSLLFSNTAEPETLPASMRYDASYQDDFDPEKDTDVTTTYYIKDAFGEDMAIAFTAPVPELLADGAEIEDVSNDQYGGMVMGHDLYFSVKKGTVSVPEAEEGEDVFPTFNLTLKVYTKDAEGNTELDFGNVDVTYTALEYGKDGYTIDDIYGGYKEDYIGTWLMYSTEDGDEYSYEVVISDEGQDAEGNEIVKIKNLSGYESALDFADELYATWSGYVLYVPGQDLEKPLVYNGAEYPVSVYPADPDTGKYYGQSNTVLAGICSDGALAFVNRYNGVNLSGFYYTAEGLGGITMFGNIYGFGPETSATGFQNFYENYRSKKMASLIGSGKPATVKVNATRLVKKTQSQPVSRTINVSNCVKPAKADTIVEFRTK